MEKMQMPPPRFEIPMPNIITGVRQKHYTKRPAPMSMPIPKKENAWARVLWPAICWLLYVLHLVVVATFFIELFKGEYDMAKHITIVATILGTYAALAYVHNNIFRRIYDGRYD